MSLATPLHSEGEAIAYPEVQTTTYRPRQSRIEPFSLCKPPQAQRIKYRCIKPPVPQESTLMQGKCKPRRPQPVGLNFRRYSALTSR